jgi:broad specificity phosphatase PhoE
MQCSSISAIPPFDRMVLLVRHAERSAVIRNRTHATAMLTEQGHADSRALGRVLARRFGAPVLWHSPVPRCRQTAEGLALGAAAAGCRVAVRGPLDWLGGDHIGGHPEWIDAQVAVDGPEGFLRRWFDGRFTAGQITPIADAASYQLRHALAQLEGLSTPVAVDVTHDWNLMLMRELFLGLRHEDVGLIPFLDMVALLQRGRRTLLWSLGLSTPIDGADPAARPRGLGAALAAMEPTGPRAPGS